jgi:hypothetical protein
LDKLLAQLHTRWRDELLAEVMERSICIKILDIELDARKIKQHSKDFIIFVTSRAVTDGKMKGVPAVLVPDIDVEVHALVILEEKLNDARIVVGNGGV